MDRGRNLEALAEEDDEEEMEEEHRRDSDSDASSTSDDDTPDEGTKRGEPNKFDILCDGVNNAMALVHTAMEELLDMKDEMLKHQLPPTLLIKLATNTGKIFRSVSDLTMPVNELVRLVRVYSQPWEEKSAALKKLHEDYEAKQRQLNIAIKRLQLVDAHSKRIAREKRIMNWEKLFAKVMSNKGHGRRWKFLIETIKSKAKLGLEHVQEFTRQLDESSDDEEDDMPTIQLKQHGGESPVSASDKVSKKSSKSPKGSKLNCAPSLETAVEGETEQEEEEEGATQAEKETQSDGGSDKEIPSIKIQEAQEEEDDDEDEEEEDHESKSSEGKKVRFAASEPAKPPVPTQDAGVWTGAPEYDDFLFVRMYSPVGMTQSDIKCSVTFGKQFFKTKRLDVEDSNKEEATKAEIKTGRFEEAEFTLPETTPKGIWQQNKKPVESPQNFQISVHSGEKDNIVAMATIDIADLKELDLRVVDLPGDHGDDDVPKTPEPPIEDDLDSLSSDIDIPLPGDEPKKPEKEVIDRVKDVDPMMFPLYSLDGSSAIHKPCGNLPLIIYWGKRARATSFNRQVGTHGVTELVFEMTGIDLEVTSKADLNKEMVDDCTSVIHFTPDCMDRALSAIRFTPEDRAPPVSPEHEPIEEQIDPDVKEEKEREPSPPPPPASPTPPAPPTPPAEPEEPKEEMVAKLELDKAMEKHSKDMLFLQEEYEKRMQTLVENLQSMEQNQQLHQQQIIKQQQQIQDQQKQLARRSPRSSPRRPRSAASPISTTTPISTAAPPATPAKKGPDTEDVHKPVVHAPMPPQKPRRSHKKRHPLVQKVYDGVPDEFLDRLQYFEDESYRHKQELFDRTKRDIQDAMEKKLAAHHKLSRKEEEMFEALNDVSLPALFMPFHRGNVFNPRAHQYFHPTGSTDLRLTQPPSVFQLPPLQRSNSSVLNLFELSKNFNSRGPGWLMDRYIQQQEPVKNAHGMVPRTSMPTSHVRSPPFTPQQTFDNQSTQGAESRVREAEAEC